MYYDGLKRRVKNAATRKALQNASSALINSIDIRQHIAPVYYALHDDIGACGHTFYNLPGGRGSCKSSFVSLEIVNGIMNDKTGASNAIAFRRFGSTMRDSVYSQIAWAIDELGVAHLWRGTISPMQYTFLPTGAQIVFRGLDDSSKLKSIKPKRGYFRYIWFEEFSELPGENFSRNVLQSVMRGGSEFIAFRSFNPPISKANWANMLVQRVDAGSVTLLTDYTMVPAEWLGDVFLTEAERLKEINERAYLHEYMGQATGSGGEVFPNLIIREITDTEIEQMQYFFCGLDWGFSVDPFAFMRCSYDNKTDTLYLLDEIYQRHCGNDKIANLIKERSFDIVPTINYESIFYPGVIANEKQTITADSAEPKSIADLNNNGLKVLACKKFPGSVLYGIKWLQNRRIVIDPKRTPNAHREFVNYEYVTTKDGEFLADVPDRDNHTIDAVRYAMDRLINRRGVSA